MIKNQYRSNAHKRYNALKNDYQSWEQKIINIKKNYDGSTYDSNELAYCRSRLNATVGLLIMVKKCMKQYNKEYNKENNNN